MKKTLSLALCAMFAALICAATVVIQIPAPTGGYINAGDCLVLLAAWTLHPVAGAAAAGTGAALADLLTGYAVYAPATFLIKAAMALAAFFTVKLIKKAPTVFSRLFSALCAEIVMVGGYFVYDAIIVGAKGAIADVIPNCIQAAGGIVLSVLLAELFSRLNIIRKD